MKIKQLSVFLENRTGVLGEVTKILADHSINMQAFSVSDGVEFGILRLIVADVEAAQQILQDAGFKVSVTEVVGINTPNIPGALSEVMQCLAREEVFIQYMYAYSEGEIASTVIRPTDVDRCIEILGKCREELIAKSALYKV